MSHSRSGENTKDRKRSAGHDQSERGSPVEHRRKKPYNGMGFLGAGSRPSTDREFVRVQQRAPERVEDPTPTQSRHNHPGPFEAEVTMGTFNLRKGKGHVRFQDGVETATCTEEVFLAVGLQIPDEGTRLTVMMIKHPNGDHQVTQVIIVKTYPFAEIHSPGDWVRASYRGFKTRQGLGMASLEPDGSLVFIFHQTLKEAGLLGLVSAEVVDVRVGMSPGGTPMVAEIRRAAVA